jgi:hypothetical protein
MKEFICICGHSSRQHTKMNKKSWDRLDKQLEGYKENSLQDREKFWTKFLTDGSQDEWRCSECDCESCKMDNLRYLEELYEAKKK